MTFDRPYGARALRGGSALCSPSGSTPTAAAPRPAPRASRTRRCSGTSSTARPGKLRLVPARAAPARALPRSSSAWRSRTRRITEPREEATVVLAIDVSRSMGAHGRDPDAARRGASRRRAASSTRSPKRFSVALVPLRQPRLRRGAADPRPRPVRQALATLHTGEGTALGDAVLLAAQLGQRQRAVDGIGAADARARSSPTARATAAARRRSPRRRRREELHVPVSTVLVGTQSGRRHRHSCTAATRSRSACRRARRRCSRSRRRAAATFFARPLEHRRSRRSTRSSRPGSGTRRGAARSPTSSRAERPCSCSRARALDASGSGGSCP